MASNPSDDQDALISTRNIEAFSRTVQATASQLVSTTPHDAYRSALGSVHRSLRERPSIQRSVFSLAQASPRELIRARFDAREIEHRAIAALPDELLRQAPEASSPFSLFEGFKASIPEADDEDEGGEDDGTSRRRKRRGRAGSRGQQRLLEEQERGPPLVLRLKRDKERLDHRLEMMGVRKMMAASEMREIDGKMSNLGTMRKLVLARLAGLEQEERDLELEINETALRVEELQDQLEEEEATAAAALATTAATTKSPPLDAVVEEEDDEADDGLATAGFMSESIYVKLPLANSSPTPDTPRGPNSKKKRSRMPRRTISTPVLHSHMEPGTQIRTLQAHNDIITSMDFDAPFGTLVTAALDDTVRVWDLSAGRCMGLLEGHLSSVRCLQVEGALVATGSMDASIRLWDLGQADYDPQQSFQDDANNYISARKSAAEEKGEVETPNPDSSAVDDPFTTSSDGKAAVPAPQNSHAMADCHLFTLSAHVAEITALHMHRTTLVSGSADKTLRQWDLDKGRCVQTLDVLWAAAQAGTTVTETAVPGAAAAGSSTAAAGARVGGGGWWRPAPSRQQNPEADFVGAVQVFDAALACGTADGLVRLWDLRSGLVSRSLVGHTGPVTALQFDDTALVTASRDRSVRVWDLRTGTIRDAFAYEAAVVGMMFDARRIVAAVEGEPGVKVYDKGDGVQWVCGLGEGEEEGAVVEAVRIKEGYLVEGRRDGVVGVWSC